MSDRRGSQYSGRKRPGAGTAHDAEAYDEPGRVRPTSRLEPDGTGVAEEYGGLDGFHSPTAMFDRGEFLGALAEEMKDVASSTRADVEAESPPRGFRIIVVSGPDIGMEWGFKQSAITIGRGGDSAISLSDIAVSWEHARIELMGAKFVLTDLRSDNGTFLNGTRIGEETLESGDEILIGARTFRFVELDEAPPTYAAHPIKEPGPEPEIGGLDDLDDALGDLMGVRGSAVDVGVVPDEDGPAAGSGSAAVVVAAKPKRTGLKLAALGLGGLATIGGLAYMGLSVYQRLSGRSPEDRARLARVQFLQGVELAKQRRCGDANLLFDAVLAERPEYTRAKEYKSYCESEIARWGQLEAAKRLAREGKLALAFAELAAIGEESQYHAEAEALAKGWRRQAADAQIADAFKLYADGDLDGAMELAETVLAAFPGHERAKELVLLVEELRAEPRKKPKAAPAEIPPLMQRAVGLYEKGNIAAAIDAAEAAGGTDAPRYVERMKKLKLLYEDIAEAHKMKAAAEVLRRAPEALKLDREIARGQGQVQATLREYYADALYLKGLEAYVAEDWGKAYSLLNEALGMKPGHRLSETRLADLSRKAGELYYQGYVLKDSNAAEARKIFRRVMDMTSRQNRFHKLASQWVAGNGG